jgi:hypothetical protein
MISCTIRKVPERCLWGALLFCTVYESYRYPLKLSFSGTSPTYADTPLAIQIPKFIITLIVCMVVIPYIAARSLPYRKWSLAVLAVCMSCYLIFKAVVSVSGDRTSYLNAAFWPLAALVIVLATSKITVAALDRYFRFVLIYALASNIIEIFLFATTGRLPALAYSDSFSVRFGGFLDDPNAFSALLYMLMGWAYYRYSGIRRFLIETALVLCILLTQSLTAIGFLGMIILLFSGYYIFYRPKPVLIIGIGVFAGTILRFVWYPLVGVISAVLETKNGSVDAHLAQTSGSQEGMGLWWLLGAPSFQNYESWWTGAAVNFGFPWYLLCMCIVAVLVLSVFRAFRRARHNHQKAVMSGLLLFSCYFAIGNLNLPFFGIFPVNFIFFFFAYLIFFDKIAEDDLGKEASLLPGATPANSSNAKPPKLLHRPVLD